jgi:DNA-binding response OmpR family regulator
MDSGMSTTIDAGASTARAVVPAVKMLVLAELDRRRIASLSCAAADSGHEVAHLRTVDQLERRLKANGSSVLLIDARHSGAETACVGVRSRAEHAGVPILVLAEEITGLTFAEAFAWGADDVVPWASPRPLVARLRSLPHTAPPPSAARGSALVVAPEPARRVVMGRILRRAGFDVVFAADVDEVQELSKRTSASLVLLESDAGDPAHALACLAELEAPPAVVIRCPPKDLSAMRSWERPGRVAVIDAFGSPENALYRANELMRGVGADGRQSRRMLHGTPVEFRPAGHRELEVGFSYNVSRGGLYVRTLSPPATDSVWLELSPPRSERVVRLDGAVAWRRGIGGHESATAPAGFGVKIMDGSSADLRAWAEGCEALEATGA